MTTTIATEVWAPATVQPIDDVRHPAARRVADVLRSRSARPRVFVLDDLENIEQAVTSGIVLHSLYVTGAARDRVLPVLAGVGPDVPHYVLGEAVARALFGEQKSARVFALAHAPRPSKLHDLIGVAGDVAVLDGVRIVGNIGAITRTVCALGAAGVVLLDSGLRTTLDRRLIRASRGLVFATPVILAGRAECVDFIRREGLTVAALSADAAQPLRAIRAVHERLALVFGGEREGIGPELNEVTTYRYAIPMNSMVDSLNVSVTAGIALYEHAFREQKTPESRGFRGSV
ncbi:NshR/TsnR family 23S rRNA methyltransferase [Microbacterium sp. Sa4CUA7]|uniref:NshR/TsnR family 23S rRNA methyltransferase n=1 Tax=Microbacterium pullorum TaxID=2762236 RepID=A0ABR8S4P3_9MICO|nr:TrmH family RNA methyltransferase [Microbacterium pullorum]MBD7958465.1 NshR/TsnR family 23S rRNA methyltransferase [Microbacterium pullorum]